MPCQGETADSKVRKVGGSDGTRIRGPLRDKAEASGSGIMRTLSPVCSRFRTQRTVIVIDLFSGGETDSAFLCDRQRLDQVEVRRLDAEQEALL